MDLKHIKSTSDVPKTCKHFTFNNAKAHNAANPLYINVTFTDDDKYIELVESAMMASEKQFVCVHMSDVPHDDKELIVHTFHYHMYKFQKYISGKSLQKRLYVHDTSRYDYKMFFETLKCTDFFNNMANEPANVMTTTKFANTIKKQFANLPKTSVEVFGANSLQKLGLNLIYSVGKASANPPMMVKIHYKTSPKNKTFALVGKGVMFDAGGLNIKVGDANSFEMKGDKIGACVAACITYLAASQKLPCNIVCLLPLVENIISGDVLHPGDILKCYNGKTVEVLNTDAEGRLIMADALAYAAQYNPDFVFDFATLTGWSRTIHCDTAAVIYTPSQSLQRLVEATGERVGERIWAMPRWPEYKKYTKSAVADYKNFDFSIRGCQYAGSGFMAAMFLTNFVPLTANNKYVHFDITSRSRQDHIMRATTALTGFNVIKKLLAQ
jgi:leucyl aminopeptidase